MACLKSKKKQARTVIKKNPAHISQLHLSARQPLQFSISRAARARASPAGRENRQQSLSLYLSLTPVQERQSEYIVVTRECTGSLSLSLFVLSPPRAAHVVVMAILIGAHAGRPSRKAGWRRRERESCKGGVCAV